MNSNPGSRLTCLDQAGLTRVARLSAQHGADRLVIRRACAHLLYCRCHLNAQPTQTAYFTLKMILQSHQKELILASSSPYRQELLARLRLPFTARAPALDESPLPGESPEQQTLRLAIAKAAQVAADVPGACVIGSDQLAECLGKRVGKPGDEQRAVEQLLQFSGRSVIFHSSVAVMCTATSFSRQATVHTEVRFRQLNEKEVRRYVILDQPFDCAGAFRSEQAGVMLLESMTSADPTAIIGLPLIALARMLRDAGFSLP
jgi:septum formation protein